MNCMETSSIRKTIPWFRMVFVRTRHTAHVEFLMEGRKYKVLTSTKTIRGICYASLEVPSDCRGYLTGYLGTIKIVEAPAQGA